MFAICCSKRRLKSKTQTNIQNTFESERLATLKAQAGRSRKSGEDKNAAVNENNLRHEDEQPAKTKAPLMKASTAARFSAKAKSGKDENATEDKHEEREDENGTRAKMPPKTNTKTRVWRRRKCR